MLRSLGRGKALDLESVKTRGAGEVAMPDGFLWSAQACLRLVSRQLAAATRLTGATAGIFSHLLTAPQNSREMCNGPGGICYTPEAMYRRIAAVMRSTS